MSSFIVENQTIDFAIRGLELLDWQKPGAIGGESLKFASGLDRLGARMLHLNDVAYCTAYRHKGFKPDTLESVFYEYQQPKGATLVQCVKAASCWLYQCAEGDCSETQLFRDWDSVIGQMNGRVVSDLPEYNATPWGHDARADTMKQPFKPTIPARQS